MVTRRQFVTGFSAIPALSYLKFDSVFAATPASILVMAIQLDIITSLDPHESFESVGSEITGNMYQQLVKPKLASLMKSKAIWPCHGPLPTIKNLYLQAGSESQMG